MNNKKGFFVRLLHPAEIDAKRISAWAELEARAIVPNAFLSPYFVMPALQGLVSTKDVFGVFVEKETAGIPSLVGVALFRAMKPTKSFPLPHLMAFESIHSYLSGFLLDKEHANDARRAIYDYLTQKKYQWHGLYINNAPIEDFFTEEAKQIAAEYGMTWTPYSTWQRAILYPQHVDEAKVATLSKHTPKDYQRHVRHLQAAGDFKWMVLRGSQPLDQSINEFIRLEHMGWKGEKGTSIYANPNHLRFFHEMTKGFNQVGRLFFTEIHLNDICISSTINLISGRAGFGFKMGWDTQYAKYSPGIINITQMMKHGQEFLGDLDYIDSSTAPESHVSKIWPGRRTLTEGIYALSTLGQAVLVGLNTAKKLKTTLLTLAKKKNLNEKAML